MREIKFRAWDTFNGIYIYSYSFSSLGMFFIECEKLVAGGNNLILQEYTGLKDKNGKEIYEGDILSPGYYDDEFFVVVFDETKSRFAEKRVSKKYPTDAGFIMDGSFIRSTLSSQRIEIIGNIYENPELLNRHC